MCNADAVGQLRNSYHGKSECSTITSLNFISKGMRLLEILVIVFRLKVDPIFTRNWITNNCASRCPGGFILYKQSCHDGILLKKSFLFVADAHFLSWLYTALVQCTGKQTLSDSFHIPITGRVSIVLSLL